MTVRHAAVRPARRGQKRPAAASPSDVRAAAPLAVVPGGIVYVAAPYSMATGGPEAIHQLVAALHTLGADARVVYVNWSDHAQGMRGSITPGGLHPAYARYGSHETTSIEDSPRNVLVLPEIWTQAVDEFRHIRTGIWWLSVDNNLGSPRGHFFERRPVRSVVHLYQSAYAADYLRSNGVRRAHALGDYLNPSHGLEDRLRDAADELGPRRDLVLFNPKKGLEVTEKLIALAAGRSASATWVPIANFTAAGVALLMRVAKVYIDFGPHPGMDRMPREAAMAGCCVVTGRRGAAAFEADLPIPERFRLEDDDLDGAVDRIFECVSDFERVSCEFDPYRAFIAGQQDRFVEDVRSVFVPRANRWAGDSMLVPAAAEHTRLAPSKRPDGRP